MPIPYKVTVSEVTITECEESYHEGIYEALAQITLLAREWGLSEPEHIEIYYCPQTKGWLMLEATQVQEEVQS